MTIPMAVMAILTQHLILFINGFSSSAKIYNSTDQNRNQTHGNTDREGGMLGAARTNCRTRCECFRCDDESPRLVPAHLRQRRRLGMGRGLQQFSPSGGRAPG